MLYVVALISAVINFYVVHAHSRRVIRIIKFIKSIIILFSKGGTAHFDGFIEKPKSEEKCKFAN